MPMSTKKPKGRTGLTRQELRDQTRYTFTAMVSTSADHSKHKPVEAESTPAKHFIVTKNLDGKGWRVTHDPTGAAIGQSYGLNCSKKLARLLCVILDAVPMGWDTLTYENYRERFDKFKRDFPEFETWYNAIRG